MEDFQQIEPIFFKEEWPKLLGRLKRQFGAQLQEEELENLLSDAYLRFRESMLAGKVGMQWSAYWYRAAYNACIDWLRKEGKEKSAALAYQEGIPEKNVNNSAQGSHKGKSLMKVLLEALHPQGALGASYRKKLQQVLKDESNVQGLYVLLEVALGYLAHDLHIRSVLLQDEVYAGVRHKEARKALGGAKGAPNRAFELGSGKVIERLQVALGEPLEPWLLAMQDQSNQEKEAQLKRLLSLAGVSWESLDQYLLEDFPTLYEHQKQLNDWQWPIFEIFLCMNEAKFNHRSIYTQTEQAPSNLLLEQLCDWLQKKGFDKRDVERFFGHKSKAKTPKGLPSLKSAVQIAFVASILREHH